MVIKKQQRGFTLIETVMYIGLFTIVITGTLVSAYQLIESGEKNRQSVEIREEGTFLQRKLNWALTGASSVSVTGGGTILTIVRPDLALESPLVITSAANELTIGRGGGSAAPLSANAFAVTNVVFTYTAAAGGRPPAIEATYDVQGKPFQFKKYLRQ